MSAAHARVVAQIADIREALQAMTVDYPRVKTHTLDNFYGRELESIAEAVRLHEITERRRNEIADAEPERRAPHARPHNQ